ncbi:MAG: antirestriction protein ArdC, partial [Pseudolabrys sp.]
AFLHITHTSRLLNVLREDNRAIVRAASQASKAAEWLLSFRSDPLVSTSIDIAGGDQEAA